MKTDANKNIIVAITGGIAAYKSAELVRHFVKSRAQVQVVMTEGAKAFITPLTLQALSGRAVRTSLLDEAAELGMGHIELAKWADHIVIAPASADVIARIAQGMANDLLTTILLAYQGDVSIAPAMNQAMWLNPITQKNILNLKSLFPHWQWIGPDAGDQACGDVGPGRMSEPQVIFDQVIKSTGLSSKGSSLFGKRIVVTAGPTLERLDPVRYISNFSSGKMGYAIAQAALDAGAEVSLISGPVIVSPPTGAKLIQVESAQQMYLAAMTESDRADVFIATAAVADYRPVEMASQKIKKTSNDSDLAIQLTQNPDIVASVSAKKTKRPFVVGFAAETNDVLAYGKSKLEKKGLDMIVINDVSDPSIGFGSDQNQVVLLTATQQDQYGPAPKKEVADWLVKQIEHKIKSKD